MRGPFDHSDDYRKRRVDFFDYRQRMWTSVYSSLTMVCPGAKNELKSLDFNIEGPGMSLDEIVKMSGLQNFDWQCRFNGTIARDTIANPMTISEITDVVNEEWRSAHHSLLTSHATVAVKFEHRL